MDNYIIVTGGDITVLMEKVNSLINQGWITQGGVCYSPQDKQFLQSMIRQVIYEDSIDEEEDDHDSMPPFFNRRSLKDQIEDQFPGRESPKTEKTPLEDFDISRRALIILNSMGIETIEELLELDIDKIPDDRIKEEIRKVIEAWKGWQDYNKKE